MDNEKSSKLGTRSENKGKKRKANRIYNILLTIVIVAIIVVAISIFSDNDDNQSDLANDIASENVNDNYKDSNTDEDLTKEEEEIADNTETNHSDQEADEEDNNQEVNESNTIVENSDDSNVQETYVNHSWKPIGTTQTGEHVTNYTKDSIDWKEMRQAIAYGAGLSEDNMTVWFLGNGGATNKAIGTVSSKDASGTAYRVYIEWVDGQGWKPVKVELLKQNDKLN